MKKNVIALAIASAVAAPVAMADAPTLFGQINMNINNTTDKGTTVNSTASRIGVKGSEDLGNGLKAIYHLEWQIDVAGGKGAVPGYTTTDSNGDTTSNSTSNISDRNAAVGLSGGFGTVLMGRWDTPLKMSQPTDFFNDGAADVSPMAGGLGVAGKGGEVRAANVLAYISPTFSGIHFVGAGVSNDTTADGSEPTLTNAYSVAAMYGSTKEGLFLSGAMNKFGSEITNGDDATEKRVSAQYAAGGLTASAMYQNFDKTGTDGKNYQLQVAYKMGKIMPKLKYSKVDYDNQADGSAYSVGLNYSLGKKTTGYVYVTKFDQEVAPAANGGDKTSTIVGMVHKF